MSAPRHTEGATEAEREAFEAWADDQGFVLKRVVLGDDYQDLRTQGPWDAWQARATLSAITPESAPEALADAGRYRWLRSKVDAHDGGLTVAKLGAFGLEPWSGDDLDAAIDSATPPAPNQGAES